MERKHVLIVLSLILLVVSTLQIYIDFKAEEGDRESLRAAVKNPGYSILIDIGEKRLYLLQDGKCIKRYPVASGKPGWPSPLGLWKIVDKGDWGEGFGGRWLGMNVPWGKYGIHGTTRESSIGSAASHGCIRMYNRHVRELYDLVPHGTPILVVDGLLGPFGRGFKNLNPGARGADVMAIQQRLKDLGYFSGNISGIYQDDLKLAVFEFQKQNGLEVTNTITKKCWLAMGFMEFE